MYIHLFMYIHPFTHANRELVYISKYIRTYIRVDTQRCVLISVRYICVRVRVRARLDPDSDADEFMYIYLH